MNTLIKLIILGFLVEALVETLKMVYQEGKLVKERILSLGVGLIVAYLTEADIMAMMGLTASVTIAGTALGGVLISRGGNFIHDFIDHISEVMGGK